jgi:hypothetical protein
MRASRGPRNRVSHPKFLVGTDREDRRRIRAIGCGSAPPGPIAHPGRSDRRAPCARRHLHSSPARGRDVLASRSRPIAASLGQRRGFLPYCPQALRWVAPPQRAPALSPLTRAPSACDECQRRRAFCVRTCRRPATTRAAVEAGSGSVDQVRVHRLRRFVRFALGVGITCRSDRNKRLNSRPGGETESRDHEGKIKAPVPVPGNSAPEKGKG